MTEENDVEMEPCSSEKKTETTRKVYLPTQPLEEGEELVCDPSAYKMLHTFETSKFMVQC